MKKFVIISVVLVLVAAAAFGVGLYHYIHTENLLHKDEVEEPQVVAETKAPEKATEPVKIKRDDTAVDTSNIFAAGSEKAEAFIADMTTEEKVGQLILGICADTSTAASEMQKYSLAGMLYKSENFQSMTKEDIPKTLADIAKDLKMKPIVAAQEEGGSFTTISDLSGFDEYDFNSLRTEFEIGGIQGVQKAEESKTNMLKSAGFNMNLAPVVDLAASGDQMMYSRSLSDEVETVSSYAEYCAKFDQPKGVSITLKHFPGYGTIPDSADTGVGAVVDEREAEDIRSIDYTPFKRGVAAGAHCVMMSNVVVQKIDPTHTSSLSPTLHNELRTNVGFSGIIMTDVLDEADYSAYADGNKPVVQAVLAGNDLILVRDYATAYNDILAAVKAGTITEKQLNDACTRVLSYKYTVGIMK